MTSQLNLFDIQDQSYQVNLYQDRAGVYGKDRWLIFGLLFIPADLELVILKSLRKAREDEECWSPLHFSELPGSWGGAGKHKPRTVYKWLTLSRTLLQGVMWFHALAIDTHLPFFERDAFSKEFHVYNRFLRMALTSAIPWFFKGKNNLTISMCFHNQTFEGYALLEFGRAGQDFDNLSDYIIGESEKDMEVRHLNQPSIWPKVQISKSIQYLPIDPNNVEDESLHSKCELLQLTDILIGAVPHAIDSISKSKTKLELASIVGEWMADIRLSPWEQTLGLHRRFGVSYYPNASGNTYSDGPLRLSNHLPGTKQG